MTTMTTTTIEDDVASSASKNSPLQHNVHGVSHQIVDVAVAIVVDAVGTINPSSTLVKLTSAHAVLVDAARQRLDATDARQAHKLVRSARVRARIIVVAIERLIRGTHQTRPDLHTQRRRSLRGSRRRPCRTESQSRCSHPTHRRRRCYRSRWSRCNRRRGCCTAAPVVVSSHPD
jgi:hypothetical protein